MEKVILTQYQSAWLRALLLRGTDPYLLSIEQTLDGDIVLMGMDGVEPVIFDNLLIDFARSQGCKAIIRGLRAVSDFEYELQIALTNRKLHPEIETVFLAPSEPFIYLSSSIVKEIARYRGHLGGFVPAPIEAHLREKFPGLQGEE